MLPTEITHPVSPEYVCIDTDTENVKYNTYDQLQSGKLDLLILQNLC